METPEEVMEHLRAELKKETSPRTVRLSTVRALTSVAKILGAVEVRDKLIPLIMNIAEGEEDEVQFAIAETLENFVPVVGGGEHAHLILKVLESMCTAEETVVRDRTAKAFSKVVSEMQWGDEGSQICLDILAKLAKGSWFTEKVLASNMYAAAFLKCNDETVRATLLESFKKDFVGDDMPMVKRSAALALVDMSDAAVKAGKVSVINDDLLPHLSNLAKDMQDSVRVCAIEALVGVIEVWTADPNHLDSCYEATSGLVMDAINDQSWRVRHALMCGFDKVAAGYTEKYSEFLVLGGSPMEKALDDVESEVRIAAVKCTPAVGESLGGASMSDCILPALNELAKDQTPLVKNEVAKAMVGLISVPSVDLKAMAGPLAMFLADGDKEDKIAVLSVLKEKLSGGGVESTVFGSGGDLEPVLNGVLELATAEDWRIRKAVILLTDTVAGTAGVEYFKGNVQPHVINGFEDAISDVRCSACAVLPALVKVLGMDWFATEIMPKLVAMYSNISTPNPMSPSANSSYLLRITVISAIGNIASEQLDSTVAASAVDLLARAARDPTPNVRFNAALALAKFGAVSSDQLTATKIKPALSEMVSDADIDCSSYATECLAKLG